MTEKRIGSLMGERRVCCTPFPQTADRNCPDPVRSGGENNGVK